MKKTIIASAIAAVVAAPAAFADVKISGQLNYEFVDVDNNDLGEDLNTDVVISGSEDLGNGMKASFKLAGSPDGSSDGFGDDQIISLSGDFGTVSVGRMETFSESKVRAMAANDASDSLSNEVAGTIGERSNGVIAYSSPSMSGFQVHAAATILDSTTSQTDDFDNTDIGISYTNGPLTVMVSQADGYGNDGETTPDLDLTKTTETSIAVKYVMGDFTVAAVKAEDDNGTSADTSETWVGVSYTMGNNTFAVSTKSSDNTGGDDDTFSVKHSLSKQTYVGLTFLNDEAGSDSAALTVGHSF
jgi:predicted porin